MSGLAPGTQVGRYQIRSRLGAGGMGEVYLAADSTLNRNVALKTLPPALAWSQDRMQRFVQEARAASALNHPNIITIHEIGETDSGPFIATEFVDGETLRARMRRGPISVREAVDIAGQIAGALAAAEAAGIVHRDVKPENVMLRRDAIVKVLDFGLAKLTEPLHDDIGETGTQAVRAVMTEPGVVMGTALYMSPEQARGGTVDRRTDIFSLGVVLYEMLAERLPFPGGTTNEVLASILNEREAIPLTRYVRDVPPELARIVAKTLQKNADERYQTVKDVVLDLKALSRMLDLEHVDAGTPRTPGRFSRRAALIVASGVAAVLLAGTYAAVKHSTGAAPIDSIAVLPFINGTGNADAEYLSDGMTESLINSLSQLRTLSVKARSTVFRYKGKDLEPQRIGQELSVQAVLIGRLAERGDQLTLNLELVDVRSGNQIWGEQYNRPVTELVTLQHDIARDVPARLRQQLSGAEAEKLTRTYTANTEAYQLYLRGRFHLNKRTPQGFQTAVDYFTQAIAADPNYALAHTGIADVYNSIPSWGYIPPRQAIPQAKAAARRALEIDATLAEAHSALATSVAVYDWDRAQAEREFKRALDINPNYAVAHFYYALMCLLPVGRFDDAIAELKRALELEPLALLINANLGGVYAYARQYDLAVDQNRRTYDLEPGFIGAQFWLIEAYIAKGMYREAIELCRKGLTGAPENQLFLAPLGYAYARAGQTRDAIEVAHTLDAMAKHQYVISYRVARIFTALGRRDEAFTWLEKAYEERDWFLSRLKIDPAFDALHQDPRFRSLETRLGLAN